jgi:hypothetical protein
MSQKSFAQIGGLYQGTTSAVPNYGHVLWPLGLAVFALPALAA